MIKAVLIFIDFSSINSNFKIIWIRQYLQNSSSIWNIIPRCIFSHLGGVMAKATLHKYFVNCFILIYLSVCL